MGIFKPGIQGTLTLTDTDTDTQIHRYTDIQIHMQGPAAFLILHHCTVTVPGSCVVMLLLVATSNPHLPTKFKIKCRS